MDAPICEWAPFIVGQGNFSRVEDSQSLPVVCPTLNFCYSPVEEIDCGHFYYSSPLSTITGTKSPDRFEWGMMLNAAGQTAVGHPTPTFSHQLYRNGVNQLTWDPGSVQSVGYWYHGSVSTFRIQINDILNWSGHVQNPQSPSGLWRGNFECVFR